MCSYLKRGRVHTLGTISQKPLRKAWICARMAVVMRCSATRSTYSRLFSFVTCRRRDQPLLPAAVGILLRP